MALDAFRALSKQSNILRIFGCIDAHETWKPPMSTSDLIATVSAVVAFAALIRPDITNYINRQRSKVEVDIIGYSDVGYSALGPTIGMTCSFYTTSDRQLLRSAEVDITSSSGRTVFKGDWYILRGTQANTTGQETLELASSTVLPGGAATKMNIVFCDSETREKMQSIGLRVRRAFQQYLATKESLDIISNRTPHEITTHFASTTPGILSLVDELKQMLPWRPGDYRITMKFHILDKGAVLSESKFTIEQSDIDELMSNVYQLIYLMAFPGQAANLNILYKKLEIYNSP